jgi:hypothetical protein
MIIDCHKCEYIMSPGTRISPMAAKQWDSRAGNSRVPLFEKARQTWIVCHLNGKKEKTK